MNTDQKIMLELASEINSICLENDITFFLSGGNALGKVRHDGMLPWDDDIDCFIKIGRAHV